MSKEKKLSHAIESVEDFSKIVVFFGFFCSRLSDFILLNFVVISKGRSKTPGTSGWVIQIFLDFREATAFKLFVCLKVLKSTRCLKKHHLQW